MSATYKRPMGVTIFAVLLISGGLWDIGLLTSDYASFRALYDWPDWLFNIRYVCSWLQLIVSVTLGVGFFFRHRFWRRMAIAVAVLSIATLYWEHYYPAILAHCQRLDAEYAEMFSSRGFGGASFAQLAVPTLIIDYATDIIFYGWLLFYLNRPHVKQYFQNADSRY